MDEELLNMLKNINKKLDSMEFGFGKRLDSIESNLKETREDVQILKTNVQSLKTDVKSLKSDTKQIKQSVKKLDALTFEEIDRLGKQLTALREAKN